MISFRINGRLPIEKSMGMHIAVSSHAPPYGIPICGSKYVLVECLFRDVGSEICGYVDRFEQRSGRGCVLVRGCA